MAIGRAALAACLLLALSGCGRDGENPASGEPSVSESATTSAAPSPNRTPEFVESPTCRRKMAPLVDIMQANSTDNLSFDVFDDRVQRLTDRIDGALLGCSNAVSRPARVLMYRFALARVQWNLCDANKCMDPVTDNIVKGLTKADAVQAALEATT